MKSDVVRKILNYVESLKVNYLLQDKFDPEKMQNRNLVQNVFDNDYFDEPDKMKTARRDSSGKYFNNNDAGLQAFLNKDIPLNSYGKNVLLN